MIKKLSPEMQGSLFVIASGLFYGLVGYFGMNLINSNLSVSNMTFWRFLVATLFIALLVISKQQKISAPNKEMVKAFLSGATFYSVSTIVYFMGSTYIGTGLAMVIFFTFPAFVIFLNWALYRSTISPTYYFSILMITAGLSLLADLGKLQLDLAGIGLALLAALLYACYIIYSKKIKLSPLISTFMICFGCAIACLFFSFANHSFVMPASLGQWRDIIGFGIFSTALPILFMLRGLKTISAEKAAIFSVLEPVFVVLFGLILLHELLSLKQLLGMCIVLLGALFTLMDYKLHLFIKRRFDSVSL